MGRSSADLGQQSAKLRAVSLGSAPHFAEHLARPSKGTVNLSGRVSRMQATGTALAIYWQPALQISAQIWNFWVLEALCRTLTTF
jgi:hypothetical protein